MNPGNFSWVQKGLNSHMVQIGQKYPWFGVHPLDQAVFSGGSFILTLTVVWLFGMQVRALEEC